MTSEERAASHLAMEAFGEALSALEQPRLGQNPYLRAGEPFVGVFPNIYVDKPGVAPLRFIFGLDLDVWVGPFSEVVLVNASQEGPVGLREVIRRVLSSTVIVTPRPRSTSITLQLADAQPWLRLTVRPRGTEEVTARTYSPFVPVP